MRAILRSVRKAGVLRALDVARFATAPFPASVGHAVRRLGARAFPYAVRGREIERLVGNLWGGFSHDAIADLTATATRSGTPRELRADAAYCLAQWHCAHGDFEEALHHARLIFELFPGNVSGRFRAILFDCLLASGRGDEARRLLDARRFSLSGRSDDALRLANTLDRGPDGPPFREWLDCVNAIYRRAGLVPVALDDPDAPVAFQNLRSAAPERAAGIHGPLVSVIVPVFNAEADLPCALRSLGDQTWRDLEIIVADDCSRDGTRRVAEAAARTDPRVKLISLTQNGGAYAARNAALEAATGAFVTTHDADDWSHPQKIELQMRDLLKRPRTAANVSHWARATPRLRFTGTLRPSARLIAWNHSSFLARREVFEALGGWDPVRASGDTEFIWRYERVFGKANRREIAPHLPLSFALDQNHSLTRNGATHAFTIFHGVRREYREAAQHWHATSAVEALRLDPNRTARAFPAPPPLTGRQPPPLDLDCVFVMDYALRGGAFVSTLNYILAAIAANMRVGVLHWPRYELGAARGIRAPIRELAQAGRLQVLTPGIAVETQYLFVCYPPIMEHVPDGFPQIAAKSVGVIVNQMAFRLHGDGDRQYDPERVTRNLERSFRTKGVWLPISPLVRRLMTEGSGYPAPHGDTWMPLIDTIGWCERPPRWLRQETGTVVIGKHGRDSYTKWPAEADDIRAAFCADKPCEVRILGGAAFALRKLRRRPKNWSILPFGSMEPQRFLADLDFYIHYPREDYIEEFGRAVLEAMASGVPTVLPPAFRETFGSAALYAEAAEVWAVICDVWRDRDAYLAQAQAGRAFARMYCGWEQFPERVARMSLAQGSM